MNTLANLIDQLKTGMWKDRRMACDQLAQLGHPDAVHPLIYALDDQDVSVREGAFAALGQLNHPLAVAPIIEHLVWEKEEAVRVAAIHALGWLRSPQAVPPLVFLLEDDLVSIRLATVRALGAIRDARALEDLIGCLGDTNLHIRAAACDALGLLKNAGGIRPLIRMLGDGEPVVREKSLEALRRLGENELVVAYSRALFGATPDATALQSLARRGDIRLVSALINRLENPWTKDDHKDHLEDTLKAIYKASLEALDHLFCTADLTRFTRQTRNIKEVGNISFLGCRTCNTTFDVIPAPTVVAVLDKKMQAKWQINEGVLRVNWANEQQLFDFNRVEIGEVDDKTVTRFCLLLSNDTDPARPQPSRDMVCDVLPAAGLNPNTVQILKRTFALVKGFRI